MKPKTDTTQNPNGYNIAFPEMSHWGVKIAGKGSNFFIRPIKGGEPNWFHRLMQRLFLGFYWDKYE